jgi:hypothetical protein
MTNPCSVTYNTGDNYKTLRYEVRYDKKHYGKTIYGSGITRKDAETLVVELEKLGRKGIEIVNLGEPE